MLKEERVFGLDLVRAVAILLVVLHHGFEIWSFRFPPLPDGVDIFFVLSGFLIGRILVKIATSRQPFTRDDLLLFLCRRWLRTLPAFWVVLIVNLVITFFVRYSDLPDRQIVKKVLLEDRLWEYGLFVQNFATNLRSNFFPESWSLSVEEWFYMIFPFMLFILHRSRFKNLLLWCVICLMVIVPSVIRYSFSDIHLPGTWMMTRMIVLMRLDSIAVGVLAAQIAVSVPTLWRKCQKSRILPLAGICIFYWLLWIVFQGEQYFGSATLTNLCFFPVSSICMMLIIPCAAAMKRGDDWLRTGISYISKISYSMYLVNYSIIVQLIKLAAGKHMTEYAPLLYGVYWVSTLHLQRFYTNT